MSARILLRAILPVTLAALLAFPALAQSQTQPPDPSQSPSQNTVQIPSEEPSQDRSQDRDREAKRLPFKPDLPNTGSNHRLILKDGSYQVIRKYEILGDRVRYISVERGGEWEELPANLVDWEATRKWEQEHTVGAYESASPAMKEAAEIDKEEAEARAEQQKRQPEVAKGLELPDSDGVFILDTFQGTPELVELTPSDMAVSGKQRHGLKSLNPMTLSKTDLELEGAHAKVHIHVNDPAIYISLEGRDDVDKLAAHALTVNTGGSHAVGNGKHGAHSERSGFALVKLDERKAVRMVGAIRVSMTGAVTQDENVQPAKAEVLDGKHWLKITPARPLIVGEYALVEIVSEKEINQSVWDFRVDPRLGDNPAAMGPLLK